MTIALSIQTVDGKPVFVGESTGNYNTYSGYSNSISISADYTAYIARIATALETIATQQTTIATQQTTIATQQTTIATATSNISTQQTTIADKQTAMETYQKKMKELSEGAGLHVIGPYELLGLLGYVPTIIENKLLKDIQKIDRVEFAKRVQELKSTLSYLQGLIGTPFSF